MSKPHALYRYRADLCGIDAGSLRLAVTMKSSQPALLKKKPMEFASWTSREIPDCLLRWRSWGDHRLVCFYTVTLPPDGSGFPARYELVRYSPAAGVILFSLFVGVIMLPLLLQQTSGKSPIMRNSC